MTRWQVPLRRALGRLAVGCAMAGFLPMAAFAQESASTWAERDTRLANEYLNLLVQQPEYGRVLDLLWNLYEKHDATKLLVENVTQQAASSPYPAVKLVEAHLVRRMGDLKKAATLYDALLKTDPDNLLVLRARADLARELADPATAFTLIQRLAQKVPDTDPSKPGLWIELGGLALAGGKNEDAAKAWETAAKLRPQDFDLARQVAQLLLQAGFPERAATFIETLSQQSDPQRRLDALSDLARIHEYADQFPKADAALKTGLALLHFRDGRYAEFFRRRVRLHERFGALEDLRKQLLEAAQKQPPSEQALRDAASFYDITVDMDERNKWLRALVKAAPDVDEYRWELVRALLDHEGAEEAAKLMDERLKGDGSDLPAIIFLRCEADLRMGNATAATERLKRLLSAQGKSLDVEKQALAFAQQRALDAVIEVILRARVDRQPDKAEAVFDLAGFYRARRDLATADTVLKAFTQSGATDAERQRRLNDAAAFLASGNDTDSAILLARQAAGRSTAGREEWLRLAELLGQDGNVDEAAALLEKAWKAGQTDEERIDVDELLFSVLMGDEKARSLTRVVEGGEFKLPDAFTGKGFASGNTDPDPKVPLSEAVTNKAAELFQAVSPNAGAQAGAGTRPKPEARDLFRAAWWAVRTGNVEQAYDLFLRMRVDPKTGLPEELSLEAEKLRLELAMTDGNKALALHALNQLIQRDPPNEIRYILRLSELLIEAEQQSVTALGESRWRREGGVPPVASEATRLLERAYRENPDAEQLLSALTQCYSIQRRADDAVSLWRSAVKRKAGSAAVPLLERFADLLLRLHRLKEYVDVQVEIVDRESDIKRRREVFKRFLDRLLWVEGGGEAAPSVARDRLTMAQEALQAQVRRHPFDGFYHEALAQVHARGGDNAKAFAAMKQAYYTTPDTPFSLDQLRDAALKVGDLKSAIYFQKQIAAGAAPKELAAESRKLVELLEQTLQIAEADRVRRNLEGRFSQDAAALEDLADYYKSTGQDDAERRVYEQIAKVRPWDARAQFRIALKCIRLADEKAAQKHLRDILEHTAAQAWTLKKAIPEKLPLPLTDVRRPDMAGPVSEVTALLEMAPGTEKAELDRLRGFLNLPRHEFVDLPQEVPMIRLRAIEELARLSHSQGGEVLQAWNAQWTARQAAFPVEALWAFYYAGSGKEFRAVLQQVMGAADSVEALFCSVWLMIKSHGMTEAVIWARQTGIRAEDIELRQRFLLASVSMLAGMDDFRFDTGELTHLANARVLRNAPVLEVTRKLQDQQRYEEALELGEGLKNHSLGLTGDYAFYLSRIAESAERWDIARNYLGQVVKGPIQPGSYRSTYDPYLFTLSAVARISSSPQQKQETLRKSWKQLQMTPDSALTSMRRAAVAGLAGAEKAAAGVLEEFITGDFLTARTLEEPRGMLMPQGSPRQEEPLHLRGLWEETREIQASMVQQGLAPVVDEVNADLEKRWGNIQLSSRTGLEFGEWRVNWLLRKLRKADFPTRMRMIREHLASVDMKQEVSVDTLSELGGRLESAGMAREAISVYRLLPARAPSNPEYATWLIRACEAGQEIEPGMSFSLQLILAEPQLKPPAVGDETLREKHAHFLALNFDLDELHRRGFLPQITRVLQGRIPAEIPYLVELAHLHERMGQPEKALAAWDRIHEVFVFNEERGLEPDAESNLHRAKLLEKKGLHPAALDALREVPLTDPLSGVAMEALNLRADILAARGEWEEFRRLMATAVDRKALQAVIRIAGLLRQHDRITEALNFLTQAERAFKEDGERFMLRLEELKLLAGEATWTPERGRSQVAAVFRAPSRDRAALEGLLNWMAEQSKTANAAAWIHLLRAEARAGTDRPVAALALCAFVQQMEGVSFDDLLAGWKNAVERDRVCLELGTAKLLALARPSLAWSACEILRGIPTLRQEGRNLPLSVQVAHALQDDTTLKEIFGEVVRMPFPGGVQTTKWTKAFEEAGQPALAREIFLAALDRLENTNGVQADLWAEWTRFLIRQKDYEAAETFLMRQNWGMPAESAQLVFELYRAWDRLPSIESELAKFHLPGGVAQEALFLAAQARNLPPPPPRR